jgi:hypothetical protein
MARQHQSLSIVVCSLVARGAVPGLDEGCGPSPARAENARDRDKETEILVLRHQIAVLKCQLGDKKVRFIPPDRVLLAALLHRLRREALDAPVREPGGP